MHPITAALLVAMFFLVSSLSGNVQAYLDPGTGSVAIQLILGGIVAGLATVRLYWDRVKTYLRRTPAEPDTSPDKN